jgi:hypothetical protein
VADRRVLELGGRGKGSLCVCWGGGGGGIGGVEGVSGWVGLLKI